MRADARFCSSAHKQANWRQTSRRRDTVELQALARIAIGAVSRGEIDGPLALAEVIWPGPLLREALRASLAEWAT
jgi:hypothetical protein